MPERLVNYLMICEEDRLWKSELADATQYQGGVNHLSKVIKVIFCWDTSTEGIQEMKTISPHWYGVTAEPPEPRDDSFLFQHK